jgi:ferredoxin
MPRFRVLNRQVEIHAQPGQSLLAAAQAAGQPWRRFCGASALCGTCAVIVVSGDVEEPRPREQVFIEGWGREPGFRLGCQLRGRDSDVCVVNCSDFDFDPDAIARALDRARTDQPEENS